MPAPIRVACVGGGPGGLFLSILLKRANPHAEISIFERNGKDDTFGWGVVFSDETLDNIASADPQTMSAIREAFVHWTDIDIYRVARSGQREHMRSTGHGFSGLSRRRLLNILQDRAAALGVRVNYHTEAASLDTLRQRHDLVVACDGANSATRDALRNAFRPSFDGRVCRFSWLGMSKSLDAFTFVFKETEFGLFRVHAYPFEAGLSTFIAECLPQTLSAAGLDAASDEPTVQCLETIFSDELAGASLLPNRSIWRQFVTVRNETWWHENVVLLGDAAHTAHFSIGSGTKLAMEDAIALSHALATNERDVPSALAAYEQARRVDVLKTQKAAETSLLWFENTEAHFQKPFPEFVFSLMSRSKRITYDNLRERDPALVEHVTQAFHAERETPQVLRSAPPIFSPFSLATTTFSNRIVVSPMCQYTSHDGVPNDWHLVHLGSRAVGGAGLVMTEAVHVSPEGRITPGCAGIYNEIHETAWRRVSDFVHTHSNAKIGMQIAHSGRKGSCDLPWLGDEPLADVDARAWTTVAPSPLPYKDSWPTPREMTRDEMTTVRQQFVDAALRAARADFDLIELHLAHGYLLSTFISPLTNVRADAYGGSLENRMRYPLEVLDAVRAVWPPSRPVAARLSSTDWAEGGLGRDDLVALSRMLKDHGCDIIDVSGGQVVSHQAPDYGRMYLAPFSELIRREVSIPTMVVGAIQDADQANTVLAAGRADLVVMARSHLLDPYLTLHAAARYRLSDEQFHWPKQYLAARPRA